MARKNNEQKILPTELLHPNAFPHVRQAIAFSQDRVNRIKIIQRKFFNFLLFYLLL